MLGFIPYSLNCLTMEYLPDDSHWSFGFKNNIAVAFKPDRSYFEKGGLMLIPVEKNFVPDVMNRILPGKKFFLILNQANNDVDGTVRNYFFRNYRVVDGIYTESYTSLGVISVYLMECKSSSKDRQ
jgi:hypothetical protein